MSYSPTNYDSIIDTCPAHLEEALHRELAILAQMHRMSITMASIAVRRNDEMEAHLKRKLGL